MESGAYFYIIGKRARFFTTSRSEMEIIMGIAEIENSYAYQDAVWGRTRKTVEHDFDLDISSALEMTAEHNDAEVIGLTTIPYAHTNMSYGLKAQYAQESTDANPVVQVTSNSKQGADEDGQSSLKMTREELLQKIRDKIDEIYEKVKNGETEVSYQIGAQSFTEKEWDRLLKSFDSVEEELHKLVEEEIEQRKKADIESRKREEAQSEQVAENEAGISKAPDAAETEEYIRSFSRLHILK